MRSICCPGEGLHIPSYHLVHLEDFLHFTASHQGEQSIATLSDGSLVRAYRRVPVTLAERHGAALQGALYFFGGHVDQVGGYLGGYLGQSRNTYGGRAAASFTRWVVQQQRIAPIGMVLITPITPYDDAFQRVVEARAIMTLSARGLWLLNSQSAAPRAARMLSAAAIGKAEGVAVEIADIIHQQIFSGKTNPYPSPTCNTREAAIRAVLNSDRALDTTEVVDELRRTGVATEGVTWDFTVRRDLHLREKHAGGTPRVGTAQHNGRRIYWNPARFSAGAAITSYDRIHRCDTTRPRTFGDPSDGVG